MATIILVVAAILIIAWLLGLGHVLHLAGSIHVSHLQPVLLIALIVIIFALVLTRR